MNSKKKICQVCAVSFTFEKFLSPLCKALYDSNYEVHVACSFSSEDLKNIPFSYEKFIFHDVDIKRSMSILDLYNSTVSLCRLFRKERFDIVHTHTPVASIAARLASFLCGVPIVIYTAHGFYFHDRMPFLVRSFHILLEKILASITTFIFTQSTEDSDFACKFKFKKKSQILPIGNGVSPLVFSPPSKSKRLRLRESYGIHPDSIVVGIVARKVLEKGYLDLLNGIRPLLDKSPSIVLVICGEHLSSDHSSNIQLQIDNFLRLYPSQVLDLGSVNDVSGVYSIMDLFCLPSWREGLPRTIIEAMMSGLPVLATNIRGCREEVIHNSTGLLVEPKSPSQIYSALSELLFDSQLRLKLGSQGRARALQLYQEMHVLNKQLNILNSLAKSV